MPLTQGPASKIKAQILANLNALVAVNGTLGAVIERDINNDILNTDMPAYPCAILGTSSMSADWEFPQANKRVYRFDILVVQLQDNLPDLGYMEDLRDALAIQFDNNVTLAGTAPLGVSAVFSERVTYADKGKNFVLFNVTIRATTLTCLNYNF